jgi:hypothetical protein
MQVLPADLRDDSIVTFAVRNRDRSRGDPPRERDFCPGPDRLDEVHLHPESEIRETSSIGRLMEGLTIDGDLVSLPFEVCRREGDREKAEHAQRSRDPL